MKIIALFITLLISTLAPIHESNGDYLSKTKIDIVGNMSFARFLNHFDKVDIPKDIDHSEIQNYKSKLHLSRQLTINRSAQIKDLRNFIPELVNGSFSRLGPPAIEPLNRFYPNENTIAVTYLTKHKLINIGFNVNLALFDLKGNHITKDPKTSNDLMYSKVIAGLFINKTILCSFSNPNVLSTTTYKNIWDKDVSEFGIQDNSISCYVKQNSNDMIIKSNGDIAVIGDEIDFAILK